MELARPGWGPFQRPFGAAEDGHVFTAGDLAHHPGVALGQMSGDVAAYGADGQQLQLGGGEGQEERHGVIHAGVAVDDQGLDRHTPRLTSQTPAGKSVSPLIPRESDAFSSHACARLTSASPGVTLSLVLRGVAIERLR